MADNNDISQLAAEAGADSSSASVTQDVTETGAAESNAVVSQDSAEIGAGASTAFVSQLPSEIGANKSSGIISQVTLEYGRGPEVVPPADSPTDTFTFDEGLGNDWFIALQLSDSGDELRDKVVKSLRVTGKVTSCLAKVYGYGPLENINVGDIEQGIGQRVAVSLPNTTQVQQSKRHQINVPHSMTHTIRIEGHDFGNGERDRIDEVVMEISRQGVRR